MHSSNPIQKLIHGIVGFGYITHLTAWYYVAMNVSLRAIYSIYTIIDPFSISIRIGYVAGRNSTVVAIKLRHIQEELISKLKLYIPRLGTISVSFYKPFFGRFTSITEIFNASATSRHSGFKAVRTGGLIFTTLANTIPHNAMTTMFKIGFTNHG